MDGSTSHNPQVEGSIPAMTAGFGRDGFVVPLPTPIYHITHVRNLRSMLAKGGLGSPNELRRRRIAFTSIANPDIQLSRSGTYVPCGPGGRVHDYVPFFFAPRPPMLYAIDRGGVAGYVEGQRPVIYLVSTAQTVQADGRQFVFCDGHSIMAISEFFGDLSRLERVDWDVMRRYWMDTRDDPDRKRRRQAEFLVFGHCPWRLIQEIGVRDREMKAHVEAELRDAGHKPPVVVRREWYY
jgi:hypothetical protein